MKMKKNIVLRASEEWTKDDEQNSNLLLSTTSANYLIAAKRKNYTGQEHNATLLNWLTSYGRAVRYWK